MTTDRQPDRGDQVPRDIPETVALERQSAEVELNRDEDVLQDPDSTLDSEDASAQDWAVADGARPDMIEETSDGLDDTDEAVRHAAEDRSR